MRTIRLSLLLAALAVLTALPALALPTTVTMTGTLTGAGGGPATDGQYAAFLSLYDKPAGGAALWSDNGVKLDLKGGVFTYELGSATPLPTDKLGALDQMWIGVQIAPDPELPRRPVGAVMVALLAQQAKALDCTGCVGAAHLDPKLLTGFAKTADLAKVATSGAYADLSGGPNLTPYAKSADLAKVASSGAYADLSGLPDVSVFAKLASLANVATTGNYKDLSGLPDLGVYAKSSDVAKLGTACGSGLVVKGLKADGTLDCVNPLDPTMLPADGLAKISNGLLTDQFVNVLPAKAPFDIKDNNPTGVGDDIVVPDLGVLQSIAVNVDLANSDISGVTLKLNDPNNVEYILYDKGLNGIAIKTTWPVPQALVKGDLGTWLGKNPKGTWHLTVIDTKFLANGTDGKVNSWSLSFGVLSNQAVAVKGNLVLANAGTPCALQYLGSVRFDTASNELQVCNGYAWQTVTVSGGKGTQASPARSCKAILDGGLSTGDGAYWLDPNGGSAADAYQAWCDMTTQGGGWTLVAKLAGQDATMNRGNITQWRHKQYIGSIANLNLEDALGASYDSIAFSDVMIRSLATPTKNLGWRHPETFPSVWSVVNTGARVSDGKKLFGAIQSLDYTNSGYHNDCSTLKYGFLMADYYYSNGVPGIAGHLHLNHGHGGAVVGASIYDPNFDQYSHNYGPDDGKTTNCVTDFGMGGGYYDLSAGANAKNLQGHYWGQGNTYTSDFNGHGLFVR